MDVRLPGELQAGVQRLLHGASRNQLGARAARISQGYRRNEPTRRLALRADDALAYLLSRLPATYAAAATVLGRLAAEVPGFAPTSLVDIGAGPGAAAWAACEVWPSLQSATLVDGNAEFLGLARQLAAGSSRPALQSATFERADIGALAPTARYDLVIASYALTELTQVETAAANWLACAEQALVVIEPGRPRDYARLMQVRRRLADDARILAPCPHAEDCPLPPGDWCHFSGGGCPGAATTVRQERGRSVRGRTVFLPRAQPERLTPMAATGASRARAATARQTQRNAEDCTPAGLEKRTLASRDKASFKRASNLGWGDLAEEWL